MLIDLVRKNRSYRRFHEEVSVNLSTLRELVELTRYCASAANLQPLKYMLFSDREKNALIFKHLAWAGYLPNWGGPVEGERPSAYIVVLGDTTIAKTFGCDHGIACQTILLGATEKGLGGCFIGAVKRKELREALSIPDHLEILARRAQRPSRAETVAQRDRRRLSAYLFKTTNSARRFFAQAVSLWAESTGRSRPKLTVLNRSFDIPSPTRYRLTLWARWSPRAIL
jgi:nitroreductase